LNVKTFFATIRTYWKTFVVASLTVFGLGLAWLLLTPLVYVSTAQLLVSIQGSTTAAAYQNDDVVSGRVNSYIALLTSDVVSQRVIDKLGLQLTAPELAAKISATDVPPKTAVIDVAVTDKSPGQARLLADTVANEFVSYTDAMETPTGDDGQKVHATVVSPASEPRSRLPERIALGVLVAIGALVLGSVAVWIRSLLDPVVRTANRAGTAAGAAVLGTVSAATAASLHDLESYRHLRTRLKTTTATDDARVWELAAVRAGINAFMVASNLGRAMQLTGRRTIVLDATVSGSPSASWQAPAQANGDETTAHDAAQGNVNGGPPAGIDAFPDTLPASAWAITPDRVATKAASDLVAQLRADYECVIVAAPPVLSTFTASAVSEYADAVLLLVSLGSTKRRDLVRAAESLTATGAPLTGVVLVDEGGQPRGPEMSSRAPELNPQRFGQSASMPAPLSGRTFGDQEPVSGLRQRREN
jgi:capsular polysaccharide biosynthesis protein